MGHIHYHALCVECKTMMNATPAGIKPEPPGILHTCPKCGHQIRLDMSESENEKYLDEMVKEKEERMIEATKKPSCLGNYLIPGESPKTCPKYCVVDDECAKITEKKIKEFFDQDFDKHQEPERLLVTKEDGKTLITPEKDFQISEEQKLGREIIRHIKDYFRDRIPVERKVKIELSKDEKGVLFSKVEVEKD